MNAVGADIRVRGVVQGVGYRHFCWRLAGTLGLAGWVRNDADGSVLLHVEGDRSSIESFIADLKVGPSNASISDLSVHWTGYSGSYTSFQITR